MAYQTPDHQQIYLEQSGNPDGIPVIYCHGGPGGGSSPFHRQLFDPALYHIIFFDQRGCGLSVLHCSWKATVLNIDRGHGIDSTASADPKLGCSWRVLAVPWLWPDGEHHPEHCLGLILRGIFLGREQDIDWLYRNVFLGQSGIS